MNLPEIERYSSEVVRISNLTITNAIDKWDDYYIIAQLINTEFEWWFRFYRVTIKNINGLVLALIPWGEYKPEDSMDCQSYNVALRTWEDVVKQSFKEINKQPLEQLVLTWKR